jgi:hypothetical protein
VPGEKDLRKSSIVSFTHGDGAKIKLAMRKLDNIGYIKYYSGVKNDHERLRGLKNKVEFFQSLATIAILEEKDAQKANATIDTELQTLAPAAKYKLVAKVNDVSKLTKKENCALLLAYVAVPFNWRRT